MDEENGASRERSSSGPLKRFVGRLKNGPSQETKNQFDSLVAMLRLSEDADEYSETSIRSYIAALRGVPGGLNSHDSYDDHLIVLALSKYHLLALKSLLDGDPKSCPSALTKRKVTYRGRSRMDDNYPVIIALYKAAYHAMARSIDTEGRSDLLATVREMAILLLNSRLPYCSTISTSCYIDMAGETYLSKFVRDLNQPIVEKAADALSPFCLQRIFMQQDASGLLMLQALLGPEAQYLSEALNCRVFEFSRSVSQVAGESVDSHGLIRGTWWDYLLETVVDGNLTSISYPFLATLHQSGYQLAYRDRDLILYLIQTLERTEATRPESLQFGLSGGQPKAYLLYIAAMDGALRGGYRAILDNLIDGAEGELLINLAGIIWEFRRQDGQVYQPLLTLLLTILNTLPDASKIYDLLVKMKACDLDYYQAIKLATSPEASQLSRTLTVLRRMRSTIRRPHEVVSHHTAGEGVSSDEEDAALAADDSIYEDMAPEISSKMVAEQRQMISEALDKHNMSRLVTWVGQGLNLEVHQALLSTHFSKHPKDFDLFDQKLREMAPQNLLIRAAFNQMSQQGGEFMVAPGSSEHLSPPREATPLYESMVDPAFSGSCQRPKALTPPPTTAGIYAQASPAGVYAVAGDDSTYTDPDAPGGRPNAIIVDGSHGCFTFGDADEAGDMMAGAYDDGGYPQPSNVYGPPGQRVIIVDGQQFSEKDYANGSAIMNGGHAAAPLPSGNHDSRPAPLPKPSSATATIRAPGSASPNGVMPRPRPRPRPRPAPPGREEPSVLGQSANGSPT